MTPERIALALAACEGLSNEELAQRGTGGYKKMIQRKRAYAESARYYGSVIEKLVPAAEAQAKELAAIKASLSMLEQLDKPVDDVSEAAALLAEIAKSGTGS